jgi:cytochrome P450
MRVVVTTTTQRKDPNAGPAWHVSDADFRRNPYPRYAELREDDVLHRNDGLWVLTRFADVQAVLRDQRMSSHPKHTPPEVIAQRMAAYGGEASVNATVQGQGSQLLADRGIELMLVADPPDHTRLRRLATKAFTPRAVERLRPRITEIVGDMLDAGLEVGQFDVMRDIAQPLPVMVICDLLGVPLDDQAQFKPWSDAIARMIDGDADQAMLMAAMPAILGFVQYFAALIEERRAQPREDLVSALVAAQDEGDSLNQGELLATIILLFIAGHETTTNLIGNGTLALLRQPDQFAALRANPALAVPGTDELLRFDGPVQLTIRRASCDLEINGLELAQGEGVICGLAAADRDPRLVDNPDALDLARGNPGHVAFGNGMHHCLGAPLARLEGQVVFEALATKTRSLELVDDDPPYRDHFILRGLSALQVEAR